MPALVARQPEDRRGVASRRLQPLAPGSLRGRSSNLPLYHRTGAVMLVDDDPSFLDALAFMMPRDWRVRTYQRATDCVETLLSESMLWEPEFRLQQHLLRQWRGGAPLIPLVLRHWAENRGPLDPTSVCVIDQHMPDMDGLNALRRLARWPGQRVMLTGSTEEELPTVAHNESLVDRVIFKHSPVFSGELIQAVARLLAMPNPRHHQIWSDTLSAEQMAVLRTPSINRDLAAYTQDNFVEWVVIGAPFSVLGRERNGAVSWLQLVTPENLDELAEGAISAGLPEADAEAVRFGAALPNFELRRCLGMESVQLVDAQLVGDEPDLLLVGKTRIDVSMQCTATAFINTMAGNQSRF